MCSENEMEILLRERERSTGEMRNQERFHSGGGRSWAALGGPVGRGPADCGGPRPRKCPAQGPGQAGNYHSLGANTLTEMLVANVTLALQGEETHR